MINIEIDDEVYSYLTSNAKPFIDKTPNDVLRRLFSLNKLREVNPKPSGGSIRKKRKQPKTNLSDLVNVGLLAEGQELFLHDYQGNLINGFSAKLTKGFLLYDNNYYSMSDLARNLLNKNGFHSDSVRGPIFWYTEKGKSVKELWDIYLKNYFK